MNSADIAGEHVGLQLSATCCHHTEELSLPSVKNTGCREKDSLTSTKLHSSKIKQQHVTVGVRFETLFTRNAVTDSRYIKQKGYPKTGRETFFFLCSISIGGSNKIN